ncbi:hypothetical protein [Streptomyces sp. NPDC003006]
MTHFDSDAALDALLEVADDAVLTAVEARLDLDTGRAALFALVTKPERGDRPAASWKFGPDGTVTDFAGIPVEPIHHHDVQVEGDTLHWSCTIDLNNLVNEILELLCKIADDLESLQRWMGAMSSEQPLAPGRAETAATMLGSLVLGVRERNMHEEMALGLVSAAFEETRTMRTELRNAHAHRMFDGDWSWADHQCRQILNSLEAAQPLVTKLFADDGEDSLPLPLPLG